MTDLLAAPEMTDGALVGDRFRIIERIGIGGMADVYRAEDARLHRTVAIKILRGAVDDPESVERAVSETTLLASLNHRGLVTLYDAHVSATSSSYLVMEYVDGITLRRHMDDGCLAPREAAALTRDLAEALHVAHESGIVHRDIKPSNVLLAPSPLPHERWRPKLADFGIAHLLDSTRVTTPGLMIGTAAYVAPEQAQGAPPAPAADIYALGLVLIEALSGRRPFADAEGIGALVARLSQPPAIPEGLDERWRQLLRGMTALHPDDRPTALEVAVTADALAADASALAEPTMSTTAPRLVEPDVEPDVTRAAAIVEAPSPQPATETAILPDLRTERRRRRWRIGAVAAGFAAITVVAGSVGAVWAQAGSTAEADPAVAPMEQAVSVPAQQPVSDRVLGAAAEDGNATETGTTAPATDPQPAAVSTSPVAGSPAPETAGNGNGKGKGSNASSNGKAKGSGNGNAKGKGGGD